MPLAAQGFEPLELFFRTDTGKTFEVEFLDHLRDGTRAVAGNDLRAHAHACQRVDRLLRVGSQGVRKQDGMSEPADMECGGHARPADLVAAQRDRGIVPGRHDPFALDLADIGKGRRFHAFRPQACRETAAERMAARLCKCEGHRFGACVEMRDIGARLAQRERAGLVEQGDIDLCQPFERCPVLDQQAFLDERTGGDHLRRRNCKSHRAGTGDDKHRNRDDERLVPAGTRDHPADESQHCQRVNRRRIEPRGAVRDTNVAAARLARFIHEARDFCQRSVALRRRNLYSQRAF